MSIIGSFGICPKNKYERLVRLVKNNKLAETEALIMEIHNELEISEEKLKNNICSGETFIALFDYFKTAFGVDILSNRTPGTQEKWREITGDYDIIVLSNKEQLLSLENAAGYDKVSQYINDFFQGGYGEIGQTVCTVLFNNLRKTDEEDILIFHLY
ncbi:MAG: hypothetical protein K1W24_00305 [Lachnospiraceae bacterium]